MFAPAPTTTADPEMDPVTPTSTTTATQEPDLSPRDDEAGLVARARRLVTRDTRTATSGGTGDPAVTAQLVSSLAALVAAATGFMVARSGRSLRRPTRRHLDDFGKPVGRILARHFDLTRLAPDLADGIDAGVVVGDYVAGGPLILPPATDVGRLASEEDEEV